MSEQREMPVMIGSYQVVEELGAGGTGRVFLGQHPVIGSKVAIKVLLPEIARSEQTVERFIQEARASSQIGSPHIPRYFDFGTTPSGLPYAVMEYFDGETLARRLARVKTLSVADTAQILAQVASALLMAHEAGLVHRDLKPENIFLVKPDFKAAHPALTRSSPNALFEPGIEVKVLDFGIAKMVGNRLAHRTQDGFFLGTPFYCAPEQVFGHPVDARTDVYGLGATAFEMLTGAPPFVGEVPQILSSKALEDPPDLRDRGVPPLVAHTVRRMLAREPAQRAPSMAWVLEEVARWTDAEADAGASLPGDLERADTMPPLHTDPAALTVQEGETLRPSRARRSSWSRRAVAVALIGVAAVAVFGVSRVLRPVESSAKPAAPALAAKPIAATGNDSATGNHVVEAVNANAIVPVSAPVAPVAAAPIDSAAAVTAAVAPASSAAAVAPAASASPIDLPTRPPRDHRTGKPAGTARKQTADRLSRPAGSSAGNSAGSSSDKPTTKQTTDVLIVDPFSHSD